MHFGDGSVQSVQLWEFYSARELHVMEWLVFPRGFWHGVAMVCTLFCNRACVAAMLSIYLTETTKARIFIIQAYILMSCTVSVCGNNQLGSSTPNILCPLVSGPVPDTCHYRCTYIILSLFVDKSAASRLRNAVCGATASHNPKLLEY